jgi:hypothetical protein
MKQEVLGKTNRIFSFDTTWTAQKTKKLGRTYRQQGNCISLKLRRGYTDRWAGTDGYTDRQQDDLISLLTFFE